MRKIQEVATDGQYSVKLYQKSKNRFEVRYGLQVTTDLNYTEAAIEFGECVMHALQCAGMLD